MKWLNDVMGRLLADKDLARKFASRDTREAALNSIVKSPHDNLSNLHTDVPLTDEQRQRLMGLPDAKNLDDLREGIAKLIQEETDLEGNLPIS